MNRQQISETAGALPLIPPVSAKHPRLYKYFSEGRWAKAFLRGELRFRSLAYFRDYEDNNVREDANEGMSLYRPHEGLIVENQRQGRTFNLSGHALESAANQEEIFVYCTSRSLTHELWKRLPLWAVDGVLGNRHAPPSGGYRYRLNAEHPRSPFGDRKWHKSRSNCAARTD